MSASTSSRPTLPARPANASSTPAPTSSCAPTPASNFTSTRESATAHPLSVPCYVRPRWRYATPTNAFSAPAYHQCPLPSTLSAHLASTDGSALDRSFC